MIRKYALPIVALAFGVFVGFTFAERDTNPQCRKLMCINENDNTVTLQRGYFTTLLMLDAKARQLDAAGYQVWLDRMHWIDEQPDYFPKGFVWPW